MELGRKELPNMMDVRHLAFEDIDKCLYRILRDSLVYLKAQGHANRSDNRRDLSILQ